MIPLPNKTKHGVVLALVVAGFVSVSPARGQATITRPVISEEACPLEAIAPVARDGHRGQGLLRKPPGAGPFPAVVWIHGGLGPRPLDALKDLALNRANPARFLAAGYLVAIITYRSRAHDPQSTVSLEDCLAALAHLRRLPFVDPTSIVVFGCSGGGDLALEIAAATTDVCAIVAEEPASFIFAGIVNANFPKKGERFTALDFRPIGDDPKRFYTSDYQKLTRAKIARIQCPILILQGDVSWVALPVLGANTVGLMGSSLGPGPVLAASVLIPRGAYWVIPFNNQVLIPELRAAGKTIQVISYPGEPHCFAFTGNQRPAAALKAFQDTDAFYRRYLQTKPRPLDPSLVKHVSLVPG